MRHARPVTTIVAILAMAASIAACGGGQPVSQATATPGSSSLPAASPSDAAPSESKSELPASSEPAATEEPSSGATPDMPSASPGESPGSGGADACTGSSENRQFFASVAGAVDWPVLCAVLPEHWFVSSGSYRLANGGKLLISYKGPGGATLALSEGSFCTDADGCVPAGNDVGDAAFGSLGGTLVRLDDGGFAIVVDRADSPSWLLVTHGLDQATTISLGAALARVGG